MNLVCDEFGSMRWQYAGHKKITESDVHIVAGTPRCKQWQLLVERLALDFLDSPRDPDAEAQRLAFRTRHLPDITTAMLQYRRLQRAWHAPLQTLPGMYSHEEHSWLVASPHGLTLHGTVHVCPHRTKRAFDKMHRAVFDDRIPAALFARLQVGMYVTERSFCDIVNFWDSRVSWQYDAFCRHRIAFEPAFIRDTFLPAAIMLWHDVRAMRDASTSAA